MGDEEDQVDEYMDVDYDADDDDIDGADMKKEIPEPEFDWKSELGKLGFPEVTIAQYARFPTRKAGSLLNVKPWSPDHESSHPFVAAQRAVDDARNLDRLALAEDSYWVGSMDSNNHLPNLLMNSLRIMEKYIKSFMYKKETAFTRVTNWMSRATNKYHFPCTLARPLG